MINITLMGGVLAWWLINTIQAIKETEQPEQPEKTGQPEIIKPPVMDRKQLVKSAMDCLYLTGAKFDTWTFCNSKTDLELMEIIKDFNIYHT